jgi:hypothetical protein
MKSILGRRYDWRRLPQPWFDMDRLEIVVPRASEYPAESLFITGLHWVPIYPDSIRSDLDEKSRIRAALDMMSGYYEIFVTYRILQILMYAHYLAIGDRNKAIIELKKGVYEFSADSHVCAPIFNTILAILLKENAEFVQSKEQLKNALAKYPRARQFLIDEKDVEAIKDGLRYWEEKTKTTLEEIEKKIPKKKFWQ